MLHYPQLYKCYPTVARDGTGAVMNLPMEEKMFKRRITGMDLRILQVVSRVLNQLRSGDVWLDRVEDIDLYEKIDGITIWSDCCNHNFHSGPIEFTADGKSGWLRGGKLKISGKVQWNELGWGNRWLPVGEWVVSVGDTTFTLKYHEF